MDVDVCKINECDQDAEILDVINNKDKKSEVTEVTKCQKVEMKVKVESDKVKLKTEIRLHKSFNELVDQAARYEKLTFDEKDVRNPGLIGVYSN
ncbi:hypothetical protein MKW92_044529 [Papaver armeniacum]|nr:hypothetical protein MKW92_044529 [Papaver armeniacum]